jgi:gas vesicle protein
MKKILLGALVCAAVAGVVYYLNDPEKFNEKLGDLKDKANDAFDSAYDKVKDGLGKAQKSANQTV